MFEFGNNKCRAASPALLLLLLLILCSYWSFFNIYRISIFGVVPQDDYAPYLLYLLGQEGGQLPGSPFVYRIFSVFLAAPFFFVLPEIKFSLIGDLNSNYMRAVQALSFAAYLSSIVATVFVYLITTKRFEGSASDGLISSLLAFCALQFSASAGTDLTAIMLLAVTYFYSRNRIIFSILVLVSVGFNEKIALIFAFIMISKVVFGRDKTSISPALISMIAISVYIVIRLLSGFPGNEHQLQAFAYPVRVAESILGLFSLKQFVLSVAPMFLVGVFYFLALSEWKIDSGRYKRYFSPSDLMALLGLFLVAMATGHQVLGRIVMYCLPLYLPVASIHIGRITFSSTSLR